MEPVFIIATIVYMFSCAGYFGYLFFQKDRLQKLAAVLMTVGVGLHTVSLVACGIRAGHFPVNNLHETLSFTAWTIAVVFLAFAFKYKLKILGIYAAPLISLTMIAAYQMPKAAALNPQLFKSWWLAAHIVTVFLGNAAFALACGLGILYLLQERAIKGKTRGFFFQPAAVPGLAGHRRLCLHRRGLFPGDHRPDHRCGLRQGRLGALLELGPQGGLVGHYLAFLRGPAPRTPDSRMARETGGDHGHHRIRCSAVHLFRREFSAAGASWHVYGHVTPGNRHITVGYQRPVAGPADGDKQPCAISYCWDSTIKPHPSTCGNASPLRRTKPNGRFPCCGTML